MSRCYEFYKKKWEDTKPIRGRAVDTRPIDKYRRYRTWETIEKRMVAVDGAYQEVYACHLYDTDVVSYYPDGSIGLRIDTWATPTTAEFMSMHSPFYICKRYNKIWVYPKGHSVDEAYPLPENGELRLVMGENGDYKPDRPIKIEKVVVDRTKAKDAREKIKPFIEWAKSFNKLTDGWVMHETREQFAIYTERLEHSWATLKVDYGLPDGVVQYRWTGTIDRVNPKQAYEYLQTCGDDGWMRVYLALTDEPDRAEESRLAKQVNLGDVGNNRVKKLYDVKFKWETLQSTIYTMVHNATDTTKKVEVEAGKPMTKVV
jgi:hypothetical protein